MPSHFSPKEELIRVQNDDILNSTVVIIIILAPLIVVSASMVSESIITPEKKRVSEGKKSPSDRKERHKLNKKPRKVRQWKPNQDEEENFNGSTALGILQSTKTRILAAITCTMSNGSPGTKCDGTSACDGMDPEKVLALAKTVATIITLVLMRMVSDKNVQHLRRVFMPSIVLVLEIASAKTVATSIALVLARMVSAMKIPKVSPQTSASTGMAQRIN
eukprot:scaffold317_cov210-Alexandrium_tamarense.AAC.4